MSNQMGPTTRSRVVKLAEETGFKVELRGDGSDIYNKNLTFTHAKLQNRLYLSTQEYGFNEAGEPSHYKVALHPDEWREDLVEPSHGIEEALNSRTERNLFSHSNYSGYPYFTGTNEPCGKCYKVSGYTALGELFKQLGSGSRARPSTRLKAIRLMNFKGIRGVESEDGTLWPVQIDLKPITLLFGPNSAGKSTVLQALAYLREVLERRNYDPDRTLVGGEYMDLGGFQNLIHGHDVSQPMKLGFVLDIADGDLPDYLTEGEAHEIIRNTNGQIAPSDCLSHVSDIGVDLTLRWSDLDQKVIVTQLDVLVNGQSLLAIEGSLGGKGVGVKYLNISHRIFLPTINLDSDGAPDEEYEPHGIMWVLRNIIRDRYFTMAPTPGIELVVQEMTSDYSPELAFNLPLQDVSDALPNLGALIKFASEVQEREPVWESPLADSLLLSSIVSALCVGPLDLMAKLLKDLLYLGPIREVPGRNLVEMRSPDLGGWARGAAAWNVLLKADNGFIGEVNYWIASQDKLNTGYRVNAFSYRELPTEHPLTAAIISGELLDEDEQIDLLNSLTIKSRVVLQEEKSGLETHPHDIGVGISQVVPVVVGALSKKSGIVAIEQPELHIHPALQVELGDLFASRLSEFGGIFLLETHSEHLILRLLRRIRETAEQDLPPDAPALTPSDVAVIYIQPGERGTEIKELRVDKTGEFVDRWPRGFFEERVEELF